jgi:phosphate uptake regulator
MKRKLIKIAEKTIVVSLPSLWLTENQLNKGDEIELDYIDEKILLSPLKPNLKTQIKQITIDIKDVSERVLRWEVASLHKQGYDEIILTSYTNEQLKIIEDLIDNLFIGFIIKEKTKLKVIVGQIAITDSTEFDSTLRRTFRQLLTMCEELYESFETKNSILLSNQTNLEHENNKLTNFCCRLLNKSLKEKEDGHFWYMVAWNLESIADSYKHIASHFKGNVPSISKELLNTIKEVNNYVKGYYECFYNFSINQMIDLNKEKIKLSEKINHLMQTSKGNETILLHHLSTIVLQTTDFSGSMIAIRHRR